MGYLLGVDLGSSNIKAAIITPNGEVVARHHTPNQIRSRKPGWMEYDVEEVWSGVARCISSCLSDMGTDHSIEAMSLTSMGEVGVPVLGDGTVLYPAISWMDERTMEQVEWWSSHFDCSYLYSVSGMPLDPMYSINRIIWLKQHEPSVFERTEKWLCLPDYVIFRLTGCLATDYTIASRTMAFDIKERRWSREICEMAGVSVDLFPDVYQSGTTVGGVTHDAAMLIGLTEGTPVVLGGHDHSCVAWILGLENETQIMDSTGTGEAIVSVTAAKELPPLALATKRYAFYPHCSPGKMLALQHMGVVGGLLNWITSLTGSGLEEFEPRDQLPLFVPHVCSRPGQDILHAPGTWIGIDRKYSASDIVASVAEGLCLWFRESLDLHKECFGCGVEDLVLTGGLARYARMSQFKANTINRPVDVTDFPDLALVGAAAIAGVGVGVYDSWEAPSNMIRIAKKRYNPETERVTACEKRFNEYWAARRGDRQLQTEEDQ